MTDAIEPWRSPPPPPSYLKTVDEVLALVRSVSGGGDGNPWARAARAQLPERRPAARLFLAWELYYQNPEARRTVLEAMSGL